MLPKDIDKLSFLIQAWIRIDTNQTSKLTTQILNEVEKYLKHGSESFKKELVELKLPNGTKFKINEDINDIKRNRKKELIALAYFLQGELSTEEEFEYIRKVLRSYLRTIQQFRSPPPPQ
ncbi:hypothetical protein H6G35_28725 [Aulosira sp. FACHB-113]|uniref:hypothetical protein n=1 Tax=Tolypothrix tenuis TaxID=457083 RepID=UPI000BBBE632|nr:hypothetical protein [Aulosira sp. FACHB-113]